MMLERIFPKAQPGPLQYGLWYVFLALWMQGEALLNILWGLLLAISIPYLAQGWAKVRPYRWLWGSVAVYLLIRITSVLYSTDMSLALRGVTDDLRIFCIGLLVLTYIQNRHELRRMIIITLAGFAVLAWRALTMHWMATHSLTTAGNVTFGSLAHSNYAAAFTCLILFVLVVLSYRISTRWRLALIPLIIPLIILQAPLSSRTSVILLIVCTMAYVLFKRSRWVVIFSTAGLLVVFFVVLSQMYGGLSQFRGVAHPMQEGAIYVRVDIWKTIARIWLDHPFGVGPRNLSATDLTPYRGWMVEHIPKSIPIFYGQNASANGLKGLDLSSPNQFVSDGHNHYVTLFAENGPLGLATLLSYLLAAMFLAARNVKREDPWVAGIAEAVCGGVFFLSGAAMMAAVLGQSGGIMLVMLIGSLVAALAPDWETVQ